MEGDLCIVRIAGCHGFKGDADLAISGNGNSLEPMKRKQLQPRRRGILPRHDMLW